MWGSSAPILAAVIAEQLHRPLLLISPHTDEADDFRDDIETALGTTPALLPQLETLPGEIDADDELAAERLRLALEFDRLRQPSGRLTAANSIPPIILASVQALMQPVPSPSAVVARSFEIAVAQTLKPEQLVEWLAANGFTACEQVEMPGDFARRGGIVDVFGQVHSNPVRIEFMGDEVESVRLFAAGTQRSSVTLQGVTIPARVAVAPLDLSQTTSFLALLPADTIIALHEPLEIQELGRTYYQRLREPAGFIPVEALLRRCNDFSVLHLQRFVNPGSDAIDLGVSSIPQFEPKSTEAVAAVVQLAHECEVVVWCENSGEQQRFRELVEQSEAAAAAAIAPAKRRLQTAIGVIHRGFRWGNVAHVPNHELFHRYNQRRTLRRVQPARPIDSFFDLSSSDYVVHTLHGIGRFRGLKTIEREGRGEEYLAIEFADQAMMHVPVSQMHLVGKYVGAKGRATLSKLGGTSWKRTKDRVAEAVTDLAAELLAVQVQRQTKEGIAYPADTEWQKEFEDAFPYTETEDQLRAIEDIKTDMARPRPMDRLLCGDVGFGKTEIAVRAVFKAIEYGKQAAVLVPTTVLAEQHFRTFSDRLADYPFTVAALSRLRSRQEQTRILAAARKGEIDVLIGTHRLLSKDVKFSDLGLVIVDEEQRFGVEAKERLKQLRTTVDVLTLSATPIPRTLHMAMLGIRDISTLATAPVDRRAIVTQVRPWDDALVREAIVREMSRDGQIYFVHNFVQSIHEIAARLGTLVPDARIVVGHGQMTGPELEDVMLQFMSRKADILVATNIIESGLDIPSANTMFINRADRFGLADMHQLRGRVGRSKHRAYCYMLLSPKHPVNEKAGRRLKAIEHYSDLGSGFQIAMRDLEIRGAGNMLGAEQSGHIEAVGYEMYCKLLEEAGRRLRNEPVEIWKQVNLELGETASIPRKYMQADKQRMDVYKRLASCHTMADVAGLRDDLTDAFGPPPSEVDMLLGLAELRVLSQTWGVRSIVLKPPDVIFAVDEMQRVQPLFAAGPGSPRVPDAHTVHWRLPARLLEMPRLLEILRKQLAGETSSTTSAAPVPSR